MTCRKVSYIGLVFLLGTPLLSIASISYECHYDRLPIIHEKIEGEDLILLKGCGVIEEGGKPLLPDDYINLIIPEAQKAKLKKVHVEQKEMYSTKWKHYKTIGRRRTETSDHGAVVADFHL